MTGIINLGTGRGRSVQEVVDILRSHFPEMRADVNNFGYPFEARKPNISTYRAGVGWSPVYDLERAIRRSLLMRRPVGRRRKAHTAVGHILVTSASKKVPMVRAVQEAARKLCPDCKVITGDIDNNALTRHVADGFWKMPRTADGEAQALIAACHERNIRTILSFARWRTDLWAEKREQFAQQGIDVVVSPAETVRTCSTSSLSRDLALRTTFRSSPLPNIPTRSETAPSLSKSATAPAAARSASILIDPPPSNTLASWTTRSTSYTYRDKKSALTLGLTACTGSRASPSYPRPSR